MKNYEITARKLYEQCIAEDCKGLVDPIQWIMNQDQMRMMWEKFVSKFDHTSNKIITDVLLNNKFSDYMKFMYQTYPAGYGNKLLEGFRKGGWVDGAEIFFTLRGY